MSRRICNSHFAALTLLAIALAACASTGAPVVNVEDALRYSAELTAARVDHRPC